MRSKTSCRLIALLCLLAAASPSPACCPVAPPNKPVLNADQEVIIVWDAAAKTQHFIRRAAFKSEADDFGFLIPVPNAPDLDESGDGAFAALRKLTEPKVVRRWR